MTTDAEDNLLLDVGAEQAAEDVNKAADEGVEEGEKAVEEGEKAVEEGEKAVEEGEKVAEDPEADNEDEDDWEDEAGEADEENNQNEAVIQRRKRRKGEKCGKLSELELRRIGEKLADILEEREKAKKRRAEEDAKKGENWLTGDLMHVCRPCSLYQLSPEVPPKLRGGSRGCSGTIMRKNKHGRERPKSELKHRCKEHEKTNLHIWCAAKEKKESEKKATFDERNEQAGKSVIRCALKNLKRGGSSIDFQDDLNLLTLTPGVVYAVRNNSRKPFFDLRDAAFESVSDKMKVFFKDIEDIAVSLDKVTVYHTSYTVIVTYFFWEGSLHVVLNELKILKVEDYDAGGTAEMVISSLCLTLGFTRTQLADKLRHFCYDGVYASPEERVSGGGCLSLVDTVTEALGLSKGDISGVWDMSHNLQVALN